MRFSDVTVVLQEVPNEVSLCFTVTGCKMSCVGCHSPYLWKEGSGQILTTELYNELLLKYKGLVSCVLFMGGEWYENELVNFLKLAKEEGLKTCLYTGLDKVSLDIKNELTYLKCGSWVNELGGLNSPKTNQRFIEVKTQKVLNELFLN
jgi:anaerobic ribonucleoside-triphosphate reductase activating protein